MEYLKEHPATTLRELCVKFDAPYNRTRKAALMLRGPKPSGPPRRLDYDRIRELWPTMSASQIAETLGERTDSVQTAAYRMGLKRRK